MKEFYHGLAIGRIQPLHNGHILLFNEVLKSCEKMTFVLGSIQESRTLKNPFTEEERKTMLTNVMQEEITNKKFNIISLPDINNLPKWGEYVLSHIEEPVDVFFTGSDFDAVPFTNYNVKSNLKIKIIDRNLYKECKNGTQIRDLLYQNNSSWKNYIPKENRYFLDSITKKEEFITKLKLFNMWGDV